MRSGRSSADLRDGALERLRRLLRQAVDQVGVDRLEAERARRAHQVTHALEALHAVHRLLHRRVEVLDAEADAVEAQSRPARQALGVRGARIDLDRDLGARRDAERRAQRWPSARCSSASLRKVGVPPPRCSCDTGWPRPSSPTCSAISASSASRYSAARSWCLVMTLLQAQ